MAEEPITLDDYSRILGLIYGCALDPLLWPETIGEICRVTHCVAGSISIHDLWSRSMHLKQVWNCDPNWIDRTARYGPEITATWEAVPNLTSRPLIEPMATSRDLPPGFETNSRYFNEARRPAGLVDALQLMVMRGRDRIGALGLQRHARVGTVGQRDLTVMRLLAPHIQRSVAIGDVLDAKTIRLGALETVLDYWQAAVVFVERDGAIVQANRAAQALLNGDGPVFAARGEIRVANPRGEDALRRSLAAIGAGDTSTGRVGVGIPVETSDGRKALIYVLPLTSGNLRARGGPRACAALVITDGGAEQGNFSVEALAAAFDLTPAEGRVLGRLLAGRTPAEAAGDLGLAVPTVRSHLASLYSKSGTERLADLILLAAQLSPPIRAA